jgi:DNA polymerase-1
VLESLRYAHPAVSLLLEYRQLAKLKSTYCDGLLKVVESDGRIRSTFNQTETRTGRISSLEPNLQNIPVRTEEGRRLRRFFRANDGYVLCAADYSQIELRVLAHMANDKNMIAAFQSGVDIHTSTAAEVFGMPIDMVTPVMRSRAKAVNFGIVYGIGAFSLAKDIGVTRAEADSYIKNYLRTYPQIDEYMHKTIENAKRDGFVVTEFGRRRYIPELASSNGMMRAFGERVARNMPIQGTAADIIKIAMIRVHKRLKDEGLDARLILEVHDALIVEAKAELADRVCEILVSEMENSAEMAVNLSVDAATGGTWYEAKQ